jgi:GMP synthase (glutamine-hydrolysing)
MGERRAPAARPRVVVVEHEKDAGPAMLGPWLADEGVSVEICRPYLGEELPDVKGCGLMVLGGTMGACDDQEAPWLAPTRAMLAAAASDGHPVLGVCLGGQMLAAACGGEVGRSPSGGEVGLGEIVLNTQGGADRLFGGIPNPSAAVQWHEDEILSLPPRAVLLASSADCAVQAFRIGERAWGLQFHPEADAALVASWAAADAEVDPSQRGRFEKAVAEIRRAERRLRETWSTMARNFAAVVKESA